MTPGSQAVPPALLDTPAATPGTRPCRPDAVQRGPPDRVGPEHLQHQERGAGSRTQPPLQRGKHVHRSAPPNLMLATGRPPCTPLSGLHICACTKPSAGGAEPSLTSVNGSRSPFRLARCGFCGVVLLTVSGSPERSCWKGPPEGMGVALLRQLPGVSAQHSLLPAPHTRGCCLLRGHQTLLGRVWSAGPGSPVWGASEGRGGGVPALWTPQPGGFRTDPVGRAGGLVARGVAVGRELGPLSFIPAAPKAWP